jgi:hypothetical protein
LCDGAGNFAFNPQSGLKCTPYKLRGQMADRAADTELMPLTQ